MRGWMRGMRARALSSLHFASNWATRPPPTDTRRARLMRALQTKRLFPASRGRRWRTATGATRQRCDGFAVGQGHPHEKATGAAVAQRVIVDAHLLPSLQRMTVPVMATQPARAHAFQSKRFRLAAFAGDVDPDEGVRLRPLEFVDGAFELL